MTTAASSIVVQAQARLRLMQMQQRIQDGEELVEPESAPVPRLLESYQFEPAAYIRDKLQWVPWEGQGDDKPGQVEVLNAYVLALRQQIERDKFEKGQPFDATIWTPGTPIKNRLRIPAGHTVGKTKLAAGIVNHFFDTCVPSIIYSFAPTMEQVHDLLWKEIKADRRHKNLPGRILDLGLTRSDNHFARGRVANNVYGTGTERAQGQHGKYLMFVLDEAEGIPDFIFNAVDSMTSGGVSIVLMLANPRTRSSTFHKQAALSTTKTFRISCLNHPNVVLGREVVPNAVRRQYVDTMLEAHTTVVPRHSEDEFTFELPWNPGVIYRPDTEFLFRVLGIAPLTVADNTMVPVGRYEAALTRAPDNRSPYQARIGLDVARYGKDAGTIYVSFKGLARRAEEIYGGDLGEYAGRLRVELLKLAAAQVNDVQIRVDAGGGYGAGIADFFKDDSEIKRYFPNFRVVEVHFNGRPYDPAAYADLATEMYAAAAESLKTLSIQGAPDALQADLCDRLYRWVIERGVAVKRLEYKDDYRGRIGRSPDDGDGFVLAIAPDHLFTSNDEWDLRAFQTLSTGVKV